MLKPSVANSLILSTKCTFPPVMAHISNFAPVVDAAADVTQFLISLESFKQSTGI